MFSESSLLQRVGIVKLVESVVTEKDCSTGSANSMLLKLRKVKVFHRYFCEVYTK